MSIVALLKKHIKIYRRQKYAYNRGWGLFGRLYNPKLSDKEATRYIRNCNRYYNYARGVMHCSLAQVRNTGPSVW